MKDIFNNGKFFSTYEELKKEKLSKHFMRENLLQGKGEEKGVSGKPLGELSSVFLKVNFACC